MICDFIDTADGLFCPRCRRTLSGLHDTMFQRTCGRREEKRRTVKSAVHARRRKICAGCEYFDSELDTCERLRLGCNLIVNQWSQKATCPEKRWPPPNCLDRRPGNVYITDAQLAADSMQLPQLLPADVDAIAGVARSGLIVASYLAAALDLPLLYANGLNGAGDVGHGARLRGRVAWPPKTIALVDDTVCSGQSIGKARELLARHHPEAHIITAAIYVLPGKSWQHVDHCVCELGPPHWLAWNWANAWMIPHMALDMDGLICRNPRPEEDDDGDRYRNFVETAEPLIFPRRHPVHIITARLEKYRPQTQAWLDRWRIPCKRLDMFPGDRPADRHGKVEQWKADLIRTSPIRWYAESEPGLARTLANRSKKPVLCPRAEKLLLPNDRSD